MSGNYRLIDTDQNDIVRFLTTTVDSFIQDRLIDRDRRTQHKEQCAERLSAENAEPENDSSEVRYSDQAVLANLDWGIEALEEAINTSNVETKLARLDYAEKMLQVCAMLDSNHRTCGVPNYYLSAWAHLNLSYLCKLKNNVSKAVIHVLDMFLVDPFFSRIDFAPELWKSLFLHHMGSIVGWYSEERRRIFMDVIPDSSDLSFTVDFDDCNYFNESLIMSVRPEQSEKIRELEKRYGESLDENTRLYAKYYKDCMNYDPATGNRRLVPMLPPIAEPPMTPFHEVNSRTIPDYVKFGPILPKSAGFSPVLKHSENPREASRSKAISTLHQNLEDSAAWDEDNDHVSGDDDDHDVDEYAEATHRAKETAVMNSFRSDSSSSRTSLRLKMVDMEATPLRERERVFSSLRQSPSYSASPVVDSPKTVNLSPQSAQNYEKGRKSMMRLLSTCSKDSKVNLPFPDSPRSACSSSVGSIESDREIILTENTTPPRKSFDHARSVRQIPTRSLVNHHGDNGNQIYASSSPSSDILPTPQSRPPKDFVCPITGQIFNDPVTLETGQTYERKAIQEWINRGNTTCPITRQPLSISSLPKTNYVLKRLITSWKDQHPDLAQDFSCTGTPLNYCPNEDTPLGLVRSSSVSSQRTVTTVVAGNTANPANSARVDQLPHRFMRASLLTSPTSVISQATIETVINSLKPHILCLCNSEDLQECEVAVLTIFKIWKESNVEMGIHSYLSSPTIVNSFSEILSASSNMDVLRTTIDILSKLICTDDRVCNLLTSIDSEFSCLTELLRQGLPEAAVLLYLLRPSYSHLSRQDLVKTLVHIISRRDEERDDLLQYVISPKYAAILLLEQIVLGGDESDRARNSIAVISQNGISVLLDCLDWVDGRQSIVSVLLHCMKIDTSCREVVANRIDLSHVLELFHGGDDCVRGVCVEFLCELVRLSRRSLANKILLMIREEGTFSTMHTLLVYLQMCPMEQKPSVATLLLQLDLLEAPRKMSIYREEAVDALIDALERKDFPSSQISALKALSSLFGHLSSSGETYMEANLLKIAGFDRPHKDTTMMGRDEMTSKEKKEEERIARTWEKRVGFVLSNHDKGAVFKALEEIFESGTLEVAKSCLVIATWLVYMLYNFPDCGTRDIARKTLLEKYITVLQSSRNVEENVLAALALRGFITEQGGLDEVGAHAKSIWRTLRRLRKHCTVVHDVMKSLMNLQSIDAEELWSCVEGSEIDVSMNGEILSMIHTRNCLLVSSHSDGTIKVWDTGKRSPRLIQEVREHTKAVTCLYVSPTCDKLYSGSLDKTIRVWSIRQDEIHCVQTHDVKEAVLELAANAGVACFATQGYGVKIYNWSGGVPKHINFSKQVKCLALDKDKLYCGCSNYSIQEVDLQAHTSSTFYSGTKKLLGKQTIYSIKIHNGLLYCGGSSVDGIAGKVFKLSSKAVVGTLSTGLDIQTITVNNEFVFASTKGGMIEVWLRERITKIACIKMENERSLRITCLCSDADGQKLFAGNSEGKVQVSSLE